MSWRASLGRMAPHLLAIVLLSAAALDFAGMLGERTGTAASVPRVLAVAIECALGIGLLRDRMSSWMLRLVLAGFLGAAVATVGLVLRDGGSAACGCLGPLGISRRTALLLQGIILTLAGLGILQESNADASLR